MECPTCRIDRKDKDFFGKDSCYKCIYRKKISSMVKRVVERKCYVCDVLIPKAKKYCSEQCKDKQKKIKHEQKKMFERLL